MIRFLLKKFHDVIENVHQEPILEVSQGSNNFVLLSKH